MYFHAPCGVVLYCFVCKLYANKEKKKKKDQKQFQGPIAVICNFAAGIYLPQSLVKQYFFIALFQLHPQLLS